MAFSTLRRLLFSQSPPTPQRETAETGAMPSAASAAAGASSSDHPTPAKSAAATAAAAAEATRNDELLPNGAPAEGARELADVCAELDDKVTRFLEEEPEDGLMRGVQARVRDSVAVIADALERYTPEELSLSYNGGKDCLVLLLLLLATLNRHSRKTSPPTPLPSTVHCIYIVPPHPFPEVDAFVAHSSTAYSLAVARSPLPMRPALAAYLASNPALRAVFVGTRRTDPHGARLSSFDETDGDWPRFMRVHPVLEWHYAEIWAFIRRMGVDYCGLYDRGYTSLGGTTDTVPNPALREGAAGGGGGFRPAYELVCDEEERLGRE